MIYISNSLHLTDNQNILRRNRPLIGWHSIIKIGDLTTSETAPDADNPITNVWSPDTYQFWKSELITSAVEETRYINFINTSGEIVDYISIVKHNFYDIGAFFKVQYYDGVLEQWIDSTEIITPGNNSTIMVYFNQVFSAQYRLELKIPSGSDNAFFQIAHIKLGRVLRLQRPMYVGMTPFTLDTESEQINSTSDNGNYLGDIIVSEWKNWEIMQKNNTQEHVRNEVIPFINHMNSVRPWDGTPQGAFIASWRPDDYPNDIIYGWKTKGQKVAPKISGPNGLMEWNCSGRAIA